MLSFRLCILAGLFLGPQMVGEALKGGRLIARVMDQEGYLVHTPTGAPACPSFIMAVEVGSRDRMIAFCKAVQRASPVGSYIEPTPGKAFLALVQLHQRLFLLHCYVMLIGCRKASTCSMTALICCLVIDCVCRCWEDPVSCKFQRRGKPNNQAELHH